MLLALAVSEPAAHAQRFEFSYTGSLVTFTVPINGTYQIIAFGAQGGDAGGVPGGRGAQIGGSFNLAAGEILQIVVGGAGMAGGGGGGGTFVVGPDNTPLVIAGAGGGAGGSAGGAGDTGESGGAGGGFDGGSGGSAGNGGHGGGPGGGGGTLGQFGGGGGGGGFLSAGGNGAGNIAPGGGGGSFPVLAGGGGGSFGSAKGGDGGFGGGGGAGDDPGGGGGGGFSGGGGGTSGRSASGGGGGGSYAAGTDQILVAGVWAGNGEVIIDSVSPVFAGMPGKANCHGKSVSALAQQFGGLNAAAAALGYSSVRELQKAILEFCEPDEAGEHRKKEHHHSEQVD